MEIESWDVSFLTNTRFAVQYLLVPVVVSFGLFGNIVAICVLTRREMRAASNIYLTALAVSDMLFLFFTFTMAWKHYEFMKSVQLYWTYVPIGLWWTDATSSCTVWITVAFTIERSVAIRHPLLVKASSEKRAKLTCAFVYMMCFLFTSTTLFEWERTNTFLTTVIAPNANKESFRHFSETQYSVHYTKLGENPSYRLLFHWFTIITFVIIPILILVVSNILLVRSLQNSRRQREVLTNNYQGRQPFNERRITTKLVAVVVLFLLCQLPTAIVLMYTSIYKSKPGSAEHNVLLGLGNIFNLLIAIGASCNCVIYTLSSRKYRQVLLSTLCRGSTAGSLKGEKQFVQDIYTQPRVEPQHKILEIGTVDRKAFQGAVVGKDGSRTTAVMSA